MNKNRYGFKIASAVVAGALLFAGSASAQNTTKAAGPEAQVSESAARQIQALLDEKQSRTTAQKKINSQLLYAIRAHALKSGAAPGGAQPATPAGAAGIAIPM